MTGLLLLAASAALLVAGAELFADNVAGAARRLGVTVLAVGLLLAGAEPEELLTAAVASARHHPGLAAGDAFGANVTMCTLTLGLAAVVRPVPFGPRVRLYAALAALVGLLAAATVVGGLVTRVEGVLLLAAYVGLVALIWRRERRPPRLGELAQVDADAAPRRPALALLLALAGVALMLLGGNLAVDGATRLITALDVRESAVGLTLLALATTAELFALVWAAARRGAGEVAVAGVVGSAAYNATATLGTAAVVRPLAVPGLGSAALGAALLPLALVTLSRSGRLDRWVGVLLVTGYAAYLALVLV